MQARPPEGGAKLGRTLRHLKKMRSGSQEVLWARSRKRLYKTEHVAHWDTPSNNELSDVDEERVALAPRIERGAIFLFPSSAAHPPLAATVANEAHPPTNCFPAQKHPAQIGLLVALCPRRRVPPTLDVYSIQTRPTLVPSVGLFHCASRYCSLLQTARPRRSLPSASTRTSQCCDSLLQGLPYSSGSGKS